MFFETLYQDLYQGENINWQGDKPLSRHKQGVEVSAENLKGFKPLKDWSFSKVAFIDGGNAQIFETSARALHICKIAIVFYEGNKIESLIVKSFFVKTTASHDFRIEFYPNIIEPVSIALDSEALSSSGSFITPSTGCNFGRRLLELYFADHVISKRLADLVVMDGSLDFRIVLEKEFIKKFENKLVVAVAKQSKIFTSKGYDFSVLLQHIASMKSLNHWLYYPVFKNEQYFKTLFVSFQKNRALRFDVTNSSFKTLDKIINFLSFQSNDILLQGYPIGLARAHSLAVIKDSDINSAKLDLVSKSINKHNHKTHKPTEVFHRFILQSNIRDLI